MSCPHYEPHPLLRIRISLQWTSQSLEEEERYSIALLRAKMKAPARSQLGGWGCMTCLLQDPQQRKVLQKLRAKWKFDFMVSRHVENLAALTADAEEGSGSLSKVEQLMCYGELTSKSCSTG